MTRRWRMPNLLAETLAVLKEHGKEPQNVLWVGATAKSRHLIGNWADFERFADFDYDAGYGGAEVEPSLVIVGAGWWLERGEYYGSEWWEFKTSPTPPSEAGEFASSEDLKSQ